MGNDIFHKNIPLLEKLINHKRGLSCKLSDPVKQQLYEIYQKTEDLWCRNLEKIDTEIKYVLIGEAPPWTFCSSVSYFYEQPTGPLISTVRKAFKDEMPKNRAETYDILARNGFLLVDSLPYSMPYTSRQRNSVPYRELVKACSGWWINKLKKSGKTFSKDLKIALGYYWNGLQLINALGGETEIKNNRLKTLKSAELN